MTWTLLKLGLDFEDHPVLVELGEDGGDLTLTECIVEDVVDRLGQDSQAGSGVAVDLQASLKPGGLLIARHIGELGQGLKLRQNSRSPSLKLLDVRVLERVLELGPADPVLHAQVLHQLQIERDSLHLR